VRTVVLAVSFAAAAVVIATLPDDEWDLPPTAA